MSLCYNATQYILEVATMQNNRPDMKKVGIKIGMMMGAVLSFFQALAGLLSAGQFTLPAFLSSFVISMLVSWVISYFIPIQKLSQSASSKCGFAPHTLRAKLVETLVSNLIFTPIMCFFNIFMAWRNMVAHGAQVKLLPMYLGALPLSFVLGYILVFVFTPICVQLAVNSSKQNGNR